MFRYLRIAILLTILVIVAGNQWLTSNRLASWDKPIWVTIYPVLAEPGDDIRRYAERLKPGSFESIGSFLKQQARRYGHQFDAPVVIQVATPLTTMPPTLPAANSGLTVALWSLKMRWWSWRNSGQKGLAADDVKMFVLYQKSKAKTPLERSVGIKNGSYGVVNAVASRQMTARNSFVIAHELLHVLGASDKYDLYTGQPLAPDGLANPSQSPLYPQKRAEIMAGRIAVSPGQWRRPASLQACAIGEVTATEIGWMK